MNNELKKFVKNRQLVSLRVIDWISLYSKTHVSDILEITRPTLNDRLKNSNWKYKEIKSIIKNFPY